LPLLKIALYTRRFLNLSLFVAVLSLVLVQGNEQVVEKVKVELFTQN
jgi:hypothetical protein